MRGEEPRCVVFFNRPINYKEKRPGWLQPIKNGFTVAKMCECQRRGNTVAFRHRQSAERLNTG